MLGGFPAARSCFCSTIWPLVSVRVTLGNGVGFRVQLFDLGTCHSIIPRLNVYIRGEGYKLKALPVNNMVEV